MEFQLARGTTIVDHRLIDTLLLKERHTNFIEESHCGDSSGKATYTTYVYSSSQMMEKL
jgi:hypothetical protein